jgi:hypothetical protein
MLATAHPCGPCTRHGARTTIIPRNRFRATRSSAYIIKNDGEHAGTGAQKGKGRANALPVEGRDGCLAAVCHDRFSFRAAALIPDHA